MSKEHRVDRENKIKTRPVAGAPGVREIVGSYRPVEWGVGGPYVLDDGPNSRESPRMTEGIPLTKVKKPQDRRFASSAGSDD